HSGRRPHDLRRRRIEHQRAPGRALGYLSKDATRAEIGSAVLTAAAGQAVLDPGVQQRLLSAAARAQDTSGPPGMPSDNGELTPREAEVLRLIADGRSNREIARALFV